MGPGCLISVRTPSAGRKVETVGYLVAEQNADRAIKIIKNEIAKLTDEVVVISRVSEELLDALHIPPGEFKRADAHPSYSPATDDN